MCTRLDRYSTLELVLSATSPAASSTRHLADHCQQGRHDLLLMHDAWQITRDSCCCTFFFRLSGDGNSLVSCDFRLDKLLLNRVETLVLYTVKTRVESVSVLREQSQWNSVVFHSSSRCEIRIFIDSEDFRV